MSVKTLKYPNTEKRKELSVAGSRFVHLDEGNLAGADVAVEVTDGDLSVMLQIALLTEDVVDTGHYFVPLIVVTIPGQNIKFIKLN